MVVLVTYENALAGAAHAVLLIVFLQALQARKNRRILLGLICFGSERVVAERVEADSVGLV